MLQSILLDVQYYCPLKLICCIYMCGIFGFVAIGSDKNVPSETIAGLAKLEYRGYDSAGICLLSEGKASIIKVKGKIQDLKNKLGDLDQYQNINIGLSHTRWATHGPPSERNAHPIVVGNFILVFNGIIDNYSVLKQNLLDQKIAFNTDTDAEIIPQMMHQLVHKGIDAESALKQILPKLEGRFAFVLLDSVSGSFYCCQNGAPLVIGKGKESIAVSSDTLAFPASITEHCFMHSGTICIIKKDLTIINKNIDGAESPLEFSLRHFSDVHVSKNGFAHYMLKEIYEEPTMMRNILNHYVAADMSINMDFSKINLTKYQRIVIVACGTSYHAGIMGKYYIEEYARIPVEVAVASEFRYKPLIKTESTLFIFISQSGETADTLAVLEMVKEDKSSATIAMVNKLESAIARNADQVLDLLAGPEISVASTKAFTAQVLSLILLSIKFAQILKIFDHSKVVQYLNELLNLPTLMEHTLNSNNYKQIAQLLYSSNLIMFIGRGKSYPMAMEGALKFKEITYIPSEGIPAGELKHGPISLIDDKVPVVAIAPFDELFFKTLSNLNEIKARNGKIIMLSSKEGYKEASDIVDYFFDIPAAKSAFEILLYAVPIQLICYYSALALDREIDQPRNLAKSVTVE